MAVFSLVSMVFGFVVLTEGSIAWSETVQIRAAVNGNNGRIVFKWIDPVIYKAEMKGKTLQISFSNVIDGDVSRITRGLPDYVTAVQLGGDGRSLSLQLSADFILAHYPSGTSIIIELAKKEPATLEIQQQSVSVQEAMVQPVQADNASNKSDDLMKVNVRTGRHSDKLRVVFDWPERIAYRLERNEGIIRLIFDRLAQIDSSKLGTVMPSLIGAARTDITASQTIVSLAVAAGATAKNFYAGSKVVVDLNFPADGSVAGKDLPALKGAQAQSATQDKVVEKVTEALEEPSSEGVSDENATVAQDDLSPTSLSTGTVAAQAGETPFDPDKPYTGESAFGANVLEDGFVFRFDWGEPTGAAVFRRGGALWMIFDNPGAVDVEALRKVADKAMPDLIQLNHPEAVILRAITAPGINPLLRKSDLGWLLEFRKQNLTTETPIESLAQPESPLGARVFLPVAEPRTAIAITDPEIGDNFVVVPVVPLGYGVNHFYKYPQFRIRPSSQGVIIEPVIDTLQIRSVSEGVSISSPEIMYISAVTEDDIVRARSDSGRPLSRIVDFSQEQDLRVRFFNVDRQDREHAIINAANQEDRILARLALVRFLLAHGYAPEALGALQVAASIDEPILELDSYYVFLGIANWMLNRYEEAAESFANEMLDKNDEGTFWRSIVSFSDGNTDDESTRGIRSTSKIPLSYPSGFGPSLVLLSIEASIFVEDFETAREQIELLGARGISEKNVTKLSLLLGKLNEAEGKVEAAIVNWEAILDSKYKPAAVQASLARIKLLLRLGRLSPKLALVELEGLRYEWRGGDFEFELLRELGTAYLQAGGYRRGLQTLRQAASYFRRNKDAIAVTQQMSDVFSELFLEGKADDMLPISAIALYEEFKELTPSGSLGDEMIRKLADRLVDVDLLEEAAVLLDNQVRFRLAGVEKARIGAQLAVVRILSKEYDMALEALDISEESDLPEQLELQRRHLKARVLAGLGDNQNALILLEDDESREAEQLRADTYRMMEDWTKAAQSLGKIIDMTGAKAGEELNEEQANYILSQAIALTLGNNDRGLIQLRRNFNQAMQNTKLYDAFKLISTPEQYGLINYSSIASKVNVVEKFQSFMADYSERLQSGESLSSIN